MSDTMEALRETTAELERIAETPLLTSTVIEIIKDDVRVATSQGVAIIKLPAKVKLKPGQAILVHGESKQFVRINPFPNDGFVATVTDIDDENHVATIDVNGRPQLFPLPEGLKAGDRVILDEHGACIIKVLPRKTQGYTVPETNVTWEDIGGNEDAKSAMVDAIENPHKYRELYEFYGAKGAKGILLYGPPGCGKTMLGKAAATSIGSAEGFIYCKGPEVLDPYVGVAEATVRSLFARARQYQEETGNRAVIFIDEAEALLGNRGARNAHMEKTIVPTFLAEMDGVEDSGAVVILATNRATSLDPAVVRDGRIDRKIEIARPSKEDAVAIVASHLRKAPCNTCKDEMAAYIVNKAWDSTFLHKGSAHALSDFVSGALFAGIVDKAKMHALRRDIADKSMTGINYEDVDAALLLTAKEFGATTIETLQ